MNKKYKLERGKADLNSSAGNYFTGAILASAVPDEPLRDFQKRRNNAISDHDILLTLTGLLCNGYTDFNDVDLFRDDRLFRVAQTGSIDDV